MTGGGDFVLGGIDQQAKMIVDETIVGEGTIY